MHQSEQGRSGLMQKGSKSGGGQGLPDRAAEEQATTGEKEGSKGLPGHNFSKCLLSLLPRHGVHREWIHRGRVGHSENLCSLQGPCLYMFEGFGRIRLRHLAGRSEMLQGRLEAAYPLVTQSRLQGKYCDHSPLLM